MPGPTLQGSCSARAPPAPRAPVQWSAEGKLHNSLRHLTGRFARRQQRAALCLTPGTPARPSAAQGVPSAKCVCMCVCVCDTHLCACCSRRCAGHYYAYVWDPHSQCWQCANDSYVQPVSQQEVLADQAYM